MSVDLRKVGSWLESVKMDLLHKICMCKSLPISHRTTQEVVARMTACTLMIIIIAVPYYSWLILAQKSLQNILKASTIKKNPAILRKKKPNFKARFSLLKEKQFVQLQKTI